MRQMMLKLWNDDCGIVLSIEVIFFVTIVLIGTIIGLVALKKAVKVELTEIANAIMALNQSYSFAGETNCESSVAGSAAADNSAGLISFDEVPPTGAGPGGAGGIDQTPCP